MYVFCGGVRVLAVVKGDLWLASFRESRLKKGDRQPSTNKNKNKIHTYHIMPEKTPKPFLPKNRK